jgi:hypothetical protein
MHRPLGERQSGEGWLALAARLIGGDRQASEDFRREFTPGIRLLAQRQLGNIGLDPLITETVEGALFEIKNGNVRTPADITRFVRGVLARQRRLAESPDPPRGVLSVPRMTPSDRTRLRHEIERMSGALGNLSRRERQMLICFFVRGFSELDIEAEFNVSREQFLGLRERLVDTLRAPRARLRKMPSSASPPLVGRSSAGRV